MNLESFSENWLKYLGIGFGAIALISIIMDNSSDDKEVISKSTPEKSANKVELVTSKSSYKKRRSRRFKDAQKKRRKFLAKSRAGINSQLFPVVRGRLIVTALFKPKPVCHVADYNAISHDMKVSQQRDLILSLESMKEGSDFKPLVQKLSLGNLKKGFKKTFRIPANLEQEVLGMFVCSGSDLVKGCRGKVPIDLNRVMYNRRKKFAAREKIYVFNLLTVKGRAVEFVSENLDQRKKAGKLMSYLSQSHDKSEVRGMFKDIVKLSHRLRSYPVKTSRNRLIVSIPYRSSRACGG